MRRWAEAKAEGLTYGQWCQEARQEKIADLTARGKPNWHETTERKAALKVEYLGLISTLTKANSKIASAKSSLRIARSAVTTARSEVTRLNRELRDALKREEYDIVGKLQWEKSAAQAALTELGASVSPLVEAVAAAEEDRHGVVARYDEVKHELQVLKEVKAWPQGAVGRRLAESMQAAQKAEAEKERYRQMAAQDGAMEAELRAVYEEWANTPEGKKELAIEAEQAAYEAGEDD